MRRKKNKGTASSEEIFESLPCENININNDINVNAGGEFIPISSIDFADGKIEFSDDDVKNRYVCYEIHDQGLSFVVNDGNKDFSKTIIVLPQYSAISGNNMYFDKRKNYIYVLTNELNNKTLSLRTSARILEEEQFMEETGIDVSKYFITRNRIELYADEISKHINLIQKCKNEETLKTILTEIMVGAVNP